MLTGAATHRQVSRLSNTVSGGRGGPSDHPGRKKGFWERPALLLLVVLSAWTSAASAEPPRGDAAVNAPKCPRGTQSALSELGCELSRQLNLDEGALVATAPVESDIPLEKAPVLAERIARVVGGSLAASLHIHGAPVSLSEARALAKRRGKLVYLTPALKNGSVQIGADVYVSARAFWDRVKAGQGGPMKHAFAERIADGEVRSFLPRPPLLVTKRDAVPLPDRSALAMACADVDGDGGAEIALLGRHRVTLGRITAGKLAPRTEKAWSELSTVAPAPLRAPLAAVRATSGFLDVGISDRAELLRLDPALGVASRSERALPWPNGGCSPLDAAGALGELTACFGDTGPWSSLVSGGLDAFAAAIAVTPSGATRRVVALRALGTQKAMLVDDAGRRAEVSDVGAQLALGDLDGDGQIELLSSRPTFDPKADGLRIDTWQNDGSVSKRLELPLSEVRAVAVCPWPGQGLSPVAVAAGDSLWVLR